MSGGGSAAGDGLGTTIDFGPCSDDDLSSLRAVNFTDAQIGFICNQLLYSNGASLGDTLTGLADGLNCLYLVLTAALVFIMHGGFAMLCAGAIRSKNTMNILLQTILDAAVSGIAFYAVGYAFAFGYGDHPNGFIGDGLFGLSRFLTQNVVSGPGHWQDFVFEWAFAATATTIPAGAVAERFNFNAYLGYSFFLSAFVYPVVAHWVWSGYGWLGYGRTYGLSHLVGAGMIDFAGSGVVHMVGGFSGIMGCILVGPRMGRFNSEGKPVDMPGHSATLVVLGTVLLWFGWYGFNPGSNLVINSTDAAEIVGRCAVTTTLAGAAGAISGLLSSLVRNKSWDLLAVCNGALCGFVAITAGCHVLEPWAAIIDGAIATLVFDAVCALFLKLRIDDPLSAGPMHGFAGMWGVFFVGLLAKKEYVYQVYNGARGTDIENFPYGLFYPGGGGRLLASQVIGILVIIGWVCTLMGIFFSIFKAFGMLRISPEEEQAGLDVSKHGGSAYNYDHGLGKPEKAHMSNGTPVISSEKMGVMVA